MMAQPVLPFSGRSPRARASSYAGAQAGAHRIGEKTRRYLALLLSGPYTDLAAAEGLGWQRSSICSVRNILVAANLVTDCADDPPYIEPRTGVRNTRWRLTIEGWRAATPAAFRERREFGL